MVHILITMYITVLIRVRWDLRIPTDLISDSRTSKKGGINLILLSPPVDEYISTVSCKQHIKNVYVQNAKGTFQKLLFQTKIFPAKMCYRVKGIAL